MKRLSILLRMLFALLAVVLLVACVPGAPAPSAEEIAAAINTAVAQTIEAQGKVATSVALTVAARETETASALPQPTATLSPLPASLPTLTPILPTATPLTISGGGGGGGGGGSSTYEYACDPDIHKRPFDNTEFNPNGTFDIKFTILNTGTATWEAGKDLMYASGPNLITNPPWVTLQLGEIKPGESFSVGPYDAMAPGESGHYVMAFKLEGGFCWPYIAINVK